MRKKQKQNPLCDQKVLLVTSFLDDALLRKAAEALLPEGKGVKIYVEDLIPAHVGFGSGTQAALATAAAVNELYGLGKSVRELAFAVKRGGTSGIGVTAFEKGGFIVDGGHRFKDKGAFMPSAASRVYSGCTISSCCLPARASP